jgi:circadian clock protein KaiB
VRLKRSASEGAMALPGEPFSIDARAKSYHVRLYVAGRDKKSRQAIDSLQNLSALFAPGRFSAEVIDLYKNTEMAKKDNILAVPAWIKIHPPPPSTFIGAGKDNFTILRRLGIPYDSAVMKADPRSLQS